MTQLCFTALIFVALTAFTACAQHDYGIHDPSGLVKENDRYYTFYTSNGVECAWSNDLCTWNRGGKIFPGGFPEWINNHVSGFNGHFWAPAVFYMNGLWHVYYSCSTFGSRVSAIGLATSPSLSEPDWEDQGMVVNTNNSSNHNAIDADILHHDGRAWLVYGSFWSGIVMTELDTTTGKPFDRSDLHYVADGDPEAAFAMHHKEHYYLFFNRGKCCDGVNSTYYINVGRSDNPAGPFLDKEGKRTSDGGGTVILKTNGRFIGPGHFGYIADNGREYVSYHYYDRDQDGASKLKISTLSWEDGWPVVNTDFDPCNTLSIKDCAGVGTPLQRRTMRHDAILYANNIVTLKSKSTGLVKLVLYTVSGRQVISPVLKNIAVGTNRLKVNASSVSRGVYLLVITDDVSAVRYDRLISVW